MLEESGVGVAVVGLAIAAAIGGVLVLADIGYRLAAPKHPTHFAIGK